MNNFLDYELTKQTIPLDNNFDMDFSNNLDIKGEYYDLGNPIYNSSNISESNKNSKELIPKITSNSVPVKSEVKIENKEQPKIEINNNTIIPPTINKVDNQLVNNIYKGIGKVKWASGKSNKNLIPEINGLIDLFENKGVDITITSAFRNTLTKQGKKSPHADGRGLDIVSKNWDDLKIALKDPDINKYMKDNGLNILDETKADRLKATGGTGPHFHIEKSISPSKMTKEDTLALLGRIGGILKMQQGGVSKQKNVSSWTSEDVDAVIAHKPKPKVTQQEYNDNIRKGRSNVIEGLLNLLSKGSTSNLLYTPIKGIQDNKSILEIFKDLITPDKQSAALSDVVTSEEWRNNNPIKTAIVNTIGDPAVIISGANAIKQSAKNIKIGNIEILPTPNPNAHYRNIGGKEGLKDVISSGIVRPPIKEVIEEPGKINLTKNFNRSFYARKGEFSNHSIYKGPYVVEAEIPMRNGYGGNWGYAPDKNVTGFVNVPVDNPNVRLLKQTVFPNTNKVLFQKTISKQLKGGILKMQQGNMLNYITELASKNKNKLDKEEFIWDGQEGYGLTAGITMGKIIGNSRNINNTESKLLTLSEKLNNPIFVDKLFNNLINNKEGYKSKAYRDSKGIWTQGVGNTYYFDKSGKQYKITDLINNPRLMDEARKSGYKDIWDNEFSKNQMIAHIKNNNTSKIDIPASDNQHLGIVGSWYNIPSLGNELGLLVKNNPNDRESHIKKIYRYLKPNKTRSDAAGLFNKRMADAWTMWEPKSDDDIKRYTEITDSVFNSLPERKIDYNKSSIEKPYETKRFTDMFNLTILNKKSQ